MATSLVNGLGGSAGFGENTLGHTDDGYSGFIDLRSVFSDGLNLFGHVYTGLYINNNGSVTFARPIGTYTPSSITAATGNPIIAPYWADVDTRVRGVSATNTNPQVAPSPGGTSTGTDLVWYDLDTANHIFTATWDDVGYYSQHTDKLNAFQLRLIGVPDSNGNYTGDFNIEFRYEAVNWTTGDASGGSGGLGGVVSRAGYSSGDGVDYFELPQSGNQAAMLSLASSSNIGVAGDWLFSLRGGAAVASISTSDVSVSEGNGSPVMYAVIPIQLAAPSASVITVAYSTADGTALAGQDYIAQRGVLTFAPGMTQQNVYVAIVGDTVAEPNESFTLNLSDAGGAPIAQAVSQVTIVNDDGLTISDVTHAEGSGGGTTPFVFTVTLLTASASPVAVSYATISGSAQPGSDYTDASGQLTFAAGEVSKQVTIAVAADSVVEADKTFTVHLSNAVGSQIARADGIGTIVNDDGIVVDDVSVVEGATANVTLRLLSAQATDVTVAWATQPGSATDGLDYKGGAGIATFLASSTLATVGIVVLQDPLVEGNETFTVALSNPTGSAIVRNTGTVTIIDDDGFSVADQTVVEGSSGGTTSMVFTVTLQSALGSAATVNYATQDGTALAGQDYTKAVGTLTFAAGVVSQTVTVAVAADTTPEPNRGYSLLLSNPSSNAGILHGAAQGLIINDDGLSVSDVSVTEGNSGTTAAVVNVTLSAASASTVTVAWATADGTAVSTSDYQAAGGVLTFAPGVTSQAVTLAVNGDTTWEADESFRVVLSDPVNSVIVDGSGSVTILNNDTRPPPALTVVSTQQTEGTGPGTTIMHFVVALSYASANAVSVQYATSDGTATAGSDYAATSGTLTIAAGSLSGIIEVPVVRDAVVEPDQSFTVTLSNPTGGATIAAGAATGTILNDDTQISVAAVTPSQAEGNSGTAAFDFLVTRSGDVTQAQTVDYAVAGATGLGLDATAADFAGGVFPSGTVSFAAGQASATVHVLVAGNNVVEPDEAFRLTLSNPSGGATLGTASATETILNDDASLIIGGSGGLTKAEGNNGTTLFSFTVTRGGATFTTVSASWQVAAIGAHPADAADFGGSFPTGTVSFAPGETSKLVSFAVIGDTVVEPDETFTVSLFNYSPGVQGATGHSGTILNDDASLAIAATSADKAEGNAGSTAFTFTVTRSGDLSVGQSARWSVAGSSAAPANAADFAGAVLPSGTVSFAAGVASQTITVNVAGDTVVEPDEGFTVSLSNPVTSDAAHALTIATATATGVIRNDDVTPPVFSIAPVSSLKAEGNSGATPFTFTVTRSGDTSGANAVAWSVSGLAPASANPADFVGGVAPSGTLSFAAGQVSQTITVNVAGDPAAEPDEHFQVVLHGPTDGAQIGTASAAATILNDDINLSIRADAASRNEDNSGSTPFTFTVTRSGILSGASTVAWSASAAGPSPVTAADFVGGLMPAGTLTFAPGVVTQAITVNILGDTYVEPNAYFQVALAGPSAGVTLITNAATSEVLNDDTTILAYAPPNPIAEGNSGTTNFVFALVRTGNLSGSSTVVWSVSGGSVNSANPADFTGGVAPQGTASFAPGVVTQYVTVGVAGDTLAEPDETFKLALTRPTGANRIGGSGDAVIANDDTNFAITSVTGSHGEGNSDSTPFVFTVTRTGLLPALQTVRWTTLGTGPNSVGPLDFVSGTPLSGTLTFAAGQTSQNITVDVQGDTLVEPDEYFRVLLSAATGGAIIPPASSSATARVINDDTAFSIAADVAAKAEGNSGSTPFTFTVTRSGSAAGTHSIGWLVTGAMPNSVGPLDFVSGTPLSGALLFLPGEVTKTITVQVQGDTLVEPDEHFMVLLRNASAGAAIPVNNAVVTVLNDDGPAPLAANAGVAPLAANAGPAPLALADFNGDGVLDSLFGGTASGFFVLDGASGVQAALTRSSVGMSFLGAADFAGHGTSALLLEGAGGGLYEWTLAGALVVQSDLVTQLGTGQSVAAVRDLTGDGRADILLHDSTAGAADPWTLLAVDGAVVAARTQYATPLAEWHLG